MEINRIKVKKILDHYGNSKQELKAIEEMAELTQALVKARDMNTDFGLISNVYEELADVTIMLEQLKLIYCDESYLNEIINQKLDRQLRRMEDDN